MTYNFDPDKWYDIQLAHLKAELDSGAIKQDDFDEAVRELDRQYDQLWKRLDGSYQV